MLECIQKCLKYLICQIIQSLQHQRETRFSTGTPTDNSKVSIHSPWILISRYPLTLLTRSGGGRSLLPSAAIVSCARTSSSSISFSITCRSFGENSVTSSRQAEKSCRAWAKSWENRKTWSKYLTCLLFESHCLELLHLSWYEHFVYSAFGTFWSSNINNDA